MDIVTYGILKNKMNGVTEDLKNSLIMQTVTDQPIASFSDGADDLPMQSVKVMIEPKQDLHGYDHPWPAGGGKNLFGLKQWLDSLNITYTQQGEKFTITSNGSLYTNPWVFSDTDVEVKFSCKSFTNETATRARITFLDTGGNIVSSRYADDVLTLNVTASKCRFDWASVGTFSIEEAQIESGSTATTYAPYSNICPISGRDSVTVTRSGVNVWDEEWEVGGIVNATGAPYATSDRIRSKNFCACLPNTNYYFRNGTIANQMVLYWYDADKNYIRYDARNNQIDTSPSNARYFKIVRIGNTYNHDISINYPSTDTDYHAYNGNTYSITFPTEAGTVYGGTLDVVSGELVVDRAMVDMGSLYWLYSSGANPYFSAAVIGMKANPYTSDNLYCSMYPTKPLPINNFTLGIRYSNGASSAIVKDPGYSDVATFKVAMSGVQLVYELATPQTYHLTPQEVRTLLGQNNIFADTGNVTAIYPTDTKTYIDDRIAILQTLMLKNNS